ncbi:hypothetical protein LC087_12480 [Bacillus carboniphilus]|uniref:Uncharacterized protein n=1 Tax=Bacillus carboniphilus TaxID=86663 RepID=A0ABY9JQK9_9BACI|nr:hypothetical protein [Bacillus carboniphilus]WLR41680.1 hypothetical protein LC087_12480 [Bacillus carboniphilus]
MNIYKEVTISTSEVIVFSTKHVIEVPVHMSNRCLHNRLKEIEIEGHYLDDLEEALREKGLRVVKHLKEEESVKESLWITKDNI